jgi:regulator of sigma E protease
LNSLGPFWYVLAFILALGPLIFIHELGHYFVGRWFGVKAETFSIGFGREVLGWTDKRGTRWKIGWLPLGGYVKFAGDMNPASTPNEEWLKLPPEERNQTFQSKPVWQRFLIVLAGPATNFLFAILGFMLIFAFMGFPSTAAVVDRVVANGPAAEAGIQPGDRVVEINGATIETFTDLLQYVRLRPEQAMDVVVERNGGRQTFSLTSRAETMRDEFGNEAKIGLIGIQGAKPLGSGEGREYLPPHRLVGAAIDTTFDTVNSMVVALGQVITGKRSVQELGGPLKIAEVSGQQASLGLLPFFWLMLVVSINLGFINLLPIPMLDGGHLLFYAIEGVRRKPLRPEAQEWAFRTGLFMLLALMIFVTFNDLASFGLFPRLGG